jgi:hypothetical protein
VVTVSSGTPTDGQVPVFTGVGNETEPGAGSGAGNGPLYLAPVKWVWLNLPQADFTIDAYTYHSVDGSGVGDTVTQNTPSDGVLSVDGGSPQVGDRIAFADLSGGYPNCGVYVVTATGNGTTVPWILTRATDNDTADELLTYWSVLVGSSGTGATFGPSARVAVAFLPGGIGVGPVGTVSIDLNVAAPGSTAIGIAAAVYPNRIAIGSLAIGDIDGDQLGPELCPLLAFGPAPLPEGPSLCAPAIWSDSIRNGAGGWVQDRLVTLQIAFHGSSGDPDAFIDFVPIQILEAYWSQTGSGQQAQLFNNPLIGHIDHVPAGGHSGPSFFGLGAFATVTADSAPVFPLTIVATVNDTFVYTPAATGIPETFTMAPTVGIADLAGLEAVVAAATGTDSDTFADYVTTTDSGSNLVFNALNGLPSNGDTITEGNGGAAAIGVTSPPDTFAGGANGGFDVQFAKAGFYNANVYGVAKLDGSASCVVSVVDGVILPPFTGEDYNVPQSVLDWNGAAILGTDLTADSDNHWIHSTAGGMVYVFSSFGIEPVGDDYPAFS